MYPRILITVITALGLTGLFNLPSFAQNYPAKSVKIIVPFAPGGVTDMVSRVMAQGLTLELGQAVIVENRAGASGIVGADAAARSAPDGYTLMMGNISTLAINSAVFAKLPYDPQTSFEPISMVARQPLVVAVNPNVPVKTIGELVAYAKANNKLNFGSAGASLQLATEAFNQAAGIQMTHVPYKGSGPAMTDLQATSRYCSMRSHPSTPSSSKAGCAAWPLRRPSARHSRLNCLLWAKWAFPRSR